MLQVASFASNITTFNQYVMDTMLATTTTEAIFPPGERAVGSRCHGLPAREARSGFSEDLLKEVRLGRCAKCLRNGGRIASRSSAETALITRVPLLAMCRHCARRDLLTKFVLSRARIDARIHSGVKPRASSRASHVRSDAVVFRQKLLAALLNMCNAAENFLRNVVGSCKRFAQKKGF